MDWEREVCVVLSIQFIVVLYLSAIFIGLQMPKRHVYHELASFISRKSITEWPCKIVF